MPLLLPKPTTTPPTSVLVRIAAQHHFQLLPCESVPRKGQLEIMLNVLFCSLSKLCVFIPDRSENKVNANIKKKRKKKRKVLLACKRPVKDSYGFPSSP